MTARKPLVLINGKVHELPDGDTFDLDPRDGPVLPLATGDVPGPVLICDEDGQPIGAPLK